jgi:hypothetical protein
VTFIFRKWPENTDFRKFLPTGVLAPFSLLRFSQNSKKQYKKERFFRRGQDLLHEGPGLKDPGSARLKGFDNPRAFMYIETVIKSPYFAII